MKRYRAFGPIVLGGILFAAIVVFPGSLWTDDNPTGDLTQNVEVFAASGVLKFHGRSETQYRDLRPGTAQISSGSFLKTGNGTADILFENNTVLCLDANTEVELGIYHNGIWICQYSGRAYHSHDPSADNLHIVQTAFYAVRAIGTEYRTWLNYPVEGAVTVEWGELGVVFPSTTNPLTGTVSPEVRVFVPQGHKVVAPIHEDVITVEPGTRIYRPDQSNKVVRGEKVIRAPNDDAWTRSRRALCRTIRNIRQRHARGLLNDNELRQKILLALGFRPDLMPRGAMDPEGGLWIGRSGYLIISLCIKNGGINEVHLIDTWTGQDKETREGYVQSVNFTMSGAAIFVIDRGGRVEGSYTESEGIWKGATVEMSGSIGTRTGRIFVSVHSETDVARYSGSIEVVDIHLVDPNGCNF